MSKIIKFAKAIRRNWKKSIFGFLVLAYGASYGVDRYKTFQMMRAYCEEAKKYGDKFQPQLQKPRHVTVILNPVAHDRKSKSMYEKYAAPLLHLAGLKVSIFQTENEGQAVDLMEIMSNTDAVIIAGGNGTLHEAVTGLLRRPEYETNNTSNIPIGIIPVGFTNSVARALFSSKTGNDAQWLAEAAMAVIRESTILLDVMRIETGEEKPLFALSSFELGAFPDIEINLSKYWYLGPLKARFAYLLQSLKKSLYIDDLSIDYVAACDGCSRCYMQSLAARNNNMIKQKRWWGSFLPRSNVDSVIPEKDYSNVINEDCGVWHSVQPAFSNLFITSGSRYFGIIPSSKALWMNLQHNDISVKQFTESGHAYHNKEPIEKMLDDSFPVREIIFKPDETSQAKSRSCYIDGEKHEVQKTHVVLMPKHLTVYA